MNLEPLASPNTPYGQAVPDVLRKYCLKIAESDFTIQVIVAGGAAAHIYTSERPSHSVDLEPLTHVFIADEIISQYRDENRETHYVHHNKLYTSDLSPMVPGYHERAIPINDEFGPNIAMTVLSPMDLSVSKLARYQSHDRKDIDAIIRMEYADPAQVREHVQEALLNYVGDTGRILDHLGLFERRHGIDGSAAPPQAMSETTQTITRSRLDEQHWQACWRTLVAPQSHVGIRLYEEALGKVVRGGDSAALSFPEPSSMDEARRLGYVLTLLAVYGQQRFSEGTREKVNAARRRLAGECAEQHLPTTNLLGENKAGQKSADMMSEGWGLDHGLELRRVLQIMQYGCC